jgi:hypothetical protein
MAEKTMLMDLSPSQKTKKPSLRCEMKNDFGKIKIICTSL